MSCLCTSSTLHWWSRNQSTIQTLTLFHGHHNIGDRYVGGDAIDLYLEVGFQLVKVELAQGDVNPLPDGALLKCVQLDPVQLLQLGPLPALPLRLYSTTCLVSALHTGAVQAPGAAGVV